jgi:hypothetical protein
MKHFFLSFFAATLFFVAPAVYAEGDWVIDNFKSDITIQKSGIVRITERIDADFGQTKKHGIYRYIPVGYRTSDDQTLTLEITVLSVTDGKKSIPYTTEYSNGNAKIQIGEANKLVSGKQIYLINYTIRGVLREFTGFDELYWNVTGDKWTVPIRKVSASVSLPRGKILQMGCYYGKTGSNNYCKNATSSDTIAAFSTENGLPPLEQMTIAAGFSKHAVTILPPLSKDVPTPDIEITFSSLGFLLSFLATFIICLGLMAKTWQEKGRDKNQSGEVISSINKETIIAEYESPLGLRPGEIGVIIDETADTLDITATIVDLAVRGYITIEEIPKKWFLGNSDYKLAKTKKEDIELLSYEKLLISSLFKNRTTADLSELFHFLSPGAHNDPIKNNSEIKISDLKNSFYQDLIGIKKELYQNVTDKKFFDENPETVRTKYSLISLAGIVGGVLLPIFFGKTNIGVFAGIGSGLFLSGIIFFFIAQKAMPKKSPLGHETYKKALGYKLFLSETEKYRAQFYEKENMFMEVLPYAIVFGVTKKLAEAMKDIGIKQPEPNWYHGSVPFNAALFATNMDTFSKSLGTALASAPSGSGSGGGGSAGGGFGGGGGGSW